jgi:hypothetical protein
MIYSGVPHFWNYVKGKLCVGANHPILNFFEVWREAEKIPMLCFKIQEHHCYLFILLKIDR